MQDNALIEAVKAGDQSAAEHLIKSGADVNQTDEQGWTPLNFAAGKGDLKLVTLLLASGADVFKTGRDNRTAYMIALAAGRVEVARRLRDAEDTTDPERARSLRPERKYCKAYHLRALRQFPAWFESRINWNQKNAHSQDQKPDEEFSDDKVVFIHQDYSVTESMWHDEHVIFNQVSDEWREFCASTLQFKVPDDFELAAATAGSQGSE